MKRNAKTTEAERASAPVRWLALAGGGFLLAPILLLVTASFNNSDFLDFASFEPGVAQYQRFFASAPWRLAVFTSLQIAGTTAAASTLLGLLAALGLSRCSFRGKRLLQLFFFSPMIIPPIVLALAYYISMSDLGLIGTRMALFIAYLPLTLPFSLMPIMASLAKVDRSLELAAMNCGAGRLTTFFRITLPLIRPGILTGALFSFMIALDEVIIAVFLCGSTAVTLPKKMWSSIRFEIEPMLPAISTLLVLLTICILVICFLLRRRF